ncbi:MAG: GGDEF domain-containing protein [Bacillota bacterium]|nr:GGDEF domain-containing protein [Bacillota bacterium]
MTKELKKIEKQKIRVLWKRELFQTPYIRCGVLLISILVVWVLKQGKLGNAGFVSATVVFGIFTLVTWAAARYRWISLRIAVIWWLVGFSADTFYAGYLIYFTGGTGSPLAPLLAASLLRVLVTYPHLPLFYVIFFVHFVVYFLACMRLGGISVIFQLEFCLTLFLLLGTGLIIAYIIKHQDEISLAKIKLAGERDEFEMLALTDGLTGIYNYRYFQYCLLEEMKRAERYGIPLSLLIFDLDFFKTYNDTFGHPAGDRVLKKVAEVLRRRLRSNDILCRYGGDEFVVILAGTGAKDAAQVAGNLKEAIKNYPFPGRQYLPGGKLTVSVGVATYPDDALNHIDLVEQADRRLYQAKSLENS